jgi:hypothetical protein
MEVTMKKYLTGKMAFLVLFILTATVMLIFNIIDIVNGEDKLFLAIINAALIAMFISHIFREVRWIKTGEVTVDADERDKAIDGKTSGITLVALDILLIAAVIVLKILNQMLAVYILVGIVVVGEIIYVVVRQIVSRKM